MENKVKNNRLEEAKAYFNFIKKTVQKNLIYRCKVHTQEDDSIVYVVKYSPTMNVVCFIFNQTNNMCRVIHKRRNPQKAQFILNEFSVERSEDFSDIDLQKQLSDANAFLIKESGYKKQDGICQIQSYACLKTFIEAGDPSKVFLSTVQSFSTSVDESGFEYTHFKLENNQDLKVPTKVLEKSKKFKVGSILVKNLSCDIQFFSPFKALKIFSALD